VTPKERVDKQNTIALTMTTETTDPKEETTLIENGHFERSKRLETKNDKKVRLKRT
jgi:hypothetical protein